VATFYLFYASISMIIRSDQIKSNRTIL